jgi:hypothetical protein
VEAAAINVFPITGFRVDTAGTVNLDGPDV